MPRHYVQTYAPAEKVDVLNDYLVDLFGDDLGTQEITLNAYLDGGTPTVATHSVGVANCSQADTNAIVAALNGQPSLAGCDCLTYPASGPQVDFWSEALAAWGVQPVVHEVP